MKKFFFFLIIVISGRNNSYAQNESSLKIDLSGIWKFKKDPHDKGVSQEWFKTILEDQVQLPGSMATNNKGDDVAVDTRWTGSIFDSSWFFKPEYNPYKKPGNIKIPFWLQPEKYYVGAAWYQKQFVAPAAWKGRHVQLSIERSHWETTVWLDGELVGMENSLATTQTFDFSNLNTGKHTLTVRVDNRIKDVNVGQNSHSISDHTQTNWNGMIGSLSLNAIPKTFIEEVRLKPILKDKTVIATIKLRNRTGQPARVKLKLSAVSVSNANRVNPVVQDVLIERDSLVKEITYPMGESPLLWDEFAPNLYKMEVAASTNFGTHKKSVQFGMKEFVAKGTQFAVNDRTIFLRGTLECAIFPKTGFPPTDVGSWSVIFRKIKSYGLNHVRFHSWCPPEAAFDAADRLGLYLQIECGSWANWGTSLGDQKPIDSYLYEESNRIVNAYGNHPSFCLMTYGNEPGGRHHVSYLKEFVKYWKEKDSRHVYTSGAGWPVIPENDFHNISDPRIQHWEEGLKSIINKEAPRADYDWKNIITKYQVPTVSHEIGQWCVYPDFKEIKKYTGVLKAKNFEIFQDVLEKNDLLHLADSFLLSSGKLQALCYKADIEAALRTQNMAGFQLLDLHDFPGQGTALVGVLNPFWEDKGYVTGKEYSAFCNSTVPLVRFSKMVFNNDESLNLPVEVAHFGAADLKKITPTWQITNATGKVLYRGSLPVSDISIGNGISLGSIQQSLKEINTASKLKLSVRIAGFENYWDFFVYPNNTESTSSKILVFQKLDAQVLNALDNGSDVIVTLNKGSIKKEKGGNIAVGFSSIFWNTAWTNGQAPHTLGVLVNPRHPAFASFPTEYYSSWQWWDAMSHADAMMLDSIGKGIKPIIRVIDDWVTGRSLGLAFECKVGKGRMILTSIDLLSDADNRIEARQLLYSFRQYMESKSFNPTKQVKWESLQGLVGAQY